MVDDDLKVPRDDMAQPRRRPTGAALPLTSCGHGRRRQQQLCARIRALSQTAPCGVLAMLLTAVCPAKRMRRQARTLRNHTDYNDREEACRCAQDGQRVRKVSKARMQGGQWVDLANRQGTGCDP